ncbi:MAG: hypothetical protein HC812_18085 [Leptolyngbya sp. RL_3_1]|nr:hypothetical protein [Leptolyngbya sp. RL_3_1]
MVRACEATLLVSSLLSPFYALQATLTLGCKAMLERVSRCALKQPGFKF